MQMHGERQTACTKHIPLTILPAPPVQQAYERRTGRSAHGWSFQNIADGCLAGERVLCQHPECWARLHSQSSLLAAVVTWATATATMLTAHAASLLPNCRPTAAPLPPLPAARSFDLCVCSFALHLCDSSSLFITLYQLACHCRWLAILAPHKQPAIREEHGWSAAEAWKVDRVHVRLYASLNFGQPLE